MSSQNPEKDTDSYKPSPSGSTDKETINESEKASAKWQDFSIASLNNVEYAARKAYLACGCQRVWRAPEPANDDVTLSDDEFYCPHTKSSK